MHSARDHLEQKLLTQASFLSCPGLLPSSFPAHPGPEFLLYRPLWHFIHMVSYGKQEVSYLFLFP